MQISRIFLRSALVMLATIAASHAQGPAPDALVKNTVDEVLAAIKQTNERQKLLQIAQTKVLPNFDFTRMTRLAVGRSWTQATPEQQQTLEKEFRDLLVRTYTNALATGTRGNVTVNLKPLGPPSASGEVTVRTEVLQSGAPPIPIDYQMEKTDAGWKVYDIAVENVSLVTNYRGSFADEIRKSGIDGLIKMLAAKNKSLADSK